jgi:hypothetical protein
MRDKRKPPMGFKRRERPAESKPNLTEGDIKRMLANPFYCGVRVDPILTLERPIDNEYIRIAAQIIREVGAEAFLWNFLQKLQDPSRPLPAETSVTDDRFLSGIQAHPFFTEERPALVSEHQFVEAGIKMIADLGPEEYLRHVLENLKGNWI